SAADGSNAFVATSLGVDPGFPRWSPDGKWITFHGDPRARPDVMVIPPQGGKPRIMETGKSNAAYPSFSRDGKWIYFAYVEAGESRIWKLPASGGAAVQVTDNAGTIAVESYDSHDLYYVSSTDRPGSIWRLPLAGGPAVKLVDGIASGAF